MASEDAAVWLEMTSDPLDGGGDWGFTRAVWAPTTKEDGTSWRRLLCRGI